MRIPRWLEIGVCAVPIFVAFVVVFLVAQIQHWRIHRHGDR